MKLLGRDFIKSALIALASATLPASNPEKWEASGQSLMDEYANTYAQDGQLTLSDIEHVRSKLESYDCSECQFEPTIHLGPCETNDYIRDPDDSIDVIGTIKARLERARCLDRKTRGRVIWVNPDGDDSNSGLSTDDAKQTIAGALASTKAGDEIWISMDCTDFDLIYFPFLGWRDLKERLDDET